MKTYRKDPEFKPVVIEIESEDELLYLWHCLSLHKSDIKKLIGQGKRFPDKVSDIQMFSQINNLLTPTKQ